MTIALMKEEDIPLLDCPGDYLIGDASGRVMNDYGRFPCKIQCGVYALMVRGSARATINIIQYDFQQNDLLLLEPGSFLLIHEFSDDALVYYVLFSSAFLEQMPYGNRMSLAQLQLSRPIVHLTDDRAEVLKEFAQMMFHAINVKPSMINTEKMVHVYQILQKGYADYARTQEEYFIRPFDRKSEIYQSYCELVLKNYHEIHHVSQYAKLMCITLPHLCATIRTVSNRTAGEIIDDAIITDAKAQLKITSLPIKEIAISLGYDNIAFFNRFFKTHVGMTPKQYRNS